MVELPDGTRERLDRLPARVIVEYLGERFGPHLGTRLAQRAAAGEPSPPDTRSMLEAIAERLNMVSGHWRLEATFSGGRLRGIERRHVRIGATQLDDFDAPDLA